MERLPEDKLLLYNPTTMEDLRKEYNLDKPGQMDEAVDLLDSWIKKQQHFTKKDFSREYLERTIIMDKGSVERAKVQLDKLMTARNLVPQFYQKLNLKTDFKELDKFLTAALVPKLTADHSRVFIAKFLHDKSTYELITGCYESTVLFWEYIRSHDYTKSMIGIVDYRDVDSILDLYTKVNVAEARQYFSLITEAYQFRIQSIHMITSSKAIELMVKLFKQLLSAKVGERIHVHRNLESLYQHVPREVLPAEYGGELKSLQELADDVKNVLSSEEVIQELRENVSARVDERLRPLDQFNEHYLGMPGSFRTLVVD